MAGNITQGLKKGRGTALGVRRQGTAGQALCKPDGRAAGW